MGSGMGAEIGPLRGVGAWGTEVVGEVGDQGAPEMDKTQINVSC